MIKLGWMTDDSAHREEKLTKWADWEYNMCLLNIYIFHRGHLHWLIWKMCSQPAAQRVERVRGCCFFTSAAAEH